MRFFSFTLATLSILMLWVFRSLALNIGTDLLDWNDYPYFVWLIFQNIHHFQDFAFSNFFETNIFYPHQGTLLFADIFLPMSVFGWLTALFTDNPITVFNIAFFVNWVLNIVAAYIFWQDFTKDKGIKFFATLATAFSPYVFLNVFHVQAIVLWPFLLSLKFLLTKQQYRFKYFWVGLFAALQFTAGVYLSIFLLFTIAYWFLLELIWSKKNWSKLKSIIRNGFIFGVTFLIFAGPLAYQYIKVKNFYQIEREYWEYVLYSSHITDYLFNSGFGSVISTSPLLKSWNSFNARFYSSAFPGFVLFTLSLFGVFSAKLRKKMSLVSINFDKEKLFFLGLLVMGFIFSLGPRLNVNGSYIGIPQPYLLVLKLIPIVEPIRVNSRWSVLFYLSLVYFSILALKKIKSHLAKKHFLVFMLGVVIVYCLDVLPINKKSHFVEYYPDVYELVATECKQTPQVLLEYPISQFRVGTDVVSGLTYRSQQLLASVTHRCLLINGYSGHYPSEFVAFESRLFTAQEDMNEEVFVKEIKKSPTDLVKLNKKDIYPNQAEYLNTWLSNEENFSILYQDEKYLLARVK